MAKALITSKANTGARRTPNHMWDVVANDTTPPLFFDLAMQRRFFEAHNLAYAGCAAAPDGNSI